MSYKDRQYDSLRFVSYEFPTYVPFVARDENRYPNLVHIPVPPQVTDPDARQRLLQLANVIDHAWMRIEQFENGKSHERTLKVFVAPEFYFRPAESIHHNTYDWDTANTIIYALIGMFSAPRYRDWLFVPGSVFCRRTPGGQEPIQGDWFHNVTAMIKGGPEGPYVFAQKLQTSNLDGAPINRPGSMDPLVLYSNDRCLPRSPSQAYEWNVLDVDARKFGVEICLDHLYHCLRWAVYYNRPFAIPDLHLLTACGMPFKAASVTARRNGFLLRTDGMIPGNNPTTILKIDQGIDQLGLDPPAVMGPPLPIRERLFLRDVALDRRIQAADLNTRNGQDIQDTLRFVDNQALVFHEPGAMPN